MRHLILGAGNMIQALTPPFIKSAQGDLFSVYTPSGKSAEAFARSQGITQQRELVDLNDVNFLWLGMKPQQVSGVAKSLSDFDFSKTVIVSLLAGVESERLSRLFDCPSVIRIMPNTPSLVGIGVNGIFFSSSVDEERKSYFLKHFSQSVKDGKNYILDREDQIDLITPYSGSGPAYFFEMARILSEDLSRRGFDKTEALELVSLTMKGAAQMLIESDDSAEVLRNKVTSKGGVTFEALKVLEENQLSSIMERAIDAALKRNNELKEV